jgi:PKHD-type hydroxylase
VILLVPNVLTAEELGVLRTELAAARFVDGRTSATGPAREQKHVLQLDRSGNAQRSLGELVARALLRHPLVQAAALPKSLRHPNINRYDVGMFYGPHLDAPIMGGNPTTRTDVSVTVFLSEPADYQGGELVIGTGAEARSIKGPAGAALLYPSGAIHQVNEVTAGSRLAAVTWIESLVRDPEQRRVLWELGEAISALESEQASPGTLLRLRASHQNLLRMWADSPAAAAR